MKMMYIKAGNQIDENGKSFIRCEGCGTPMYEGELVLEHEYGQLYCSWKCLCIYGFYGHYKKVTLDKKKMNEN